MLELLESGKGVTQAEIARREGLSRARVTQIMSLTSLAPDIWEHILSMPKTVRKPVVMERSLRPIVLLEGQDEQLEAFEKLIGAEFLSVLERKKVSGNVYMQG